MFRSLRENINIKLYDSKDVIITLFRVLALIASILSFGALIYYYGYPQTETSRAVLVEIIRVSFIVFILQYILQVIYSFEIRSFLKRTWFKALLMILLLAEGISFYFFQTLLIPEFIKLVLHHDISAYYSYIIHIYFLILIIVEISSYSGYFPKRKRINPAFIFVGIFLILIFGGSLLLMMPEMLKVPGSISYTTALFTSTSATCVTGLVVVDPGLTFTHKGFFVIMLLIQAGGMNIISFGTLVALFSKIGVGLKQHEVMEDLINKNSMLNAKGMFRRVITWVLAIEIIGAIVLFFSWSNSVPFENLGEKIFYSLFQSISAFNNSGISTFSGNLNNPAVRHNILALDVIGVIIILGSLGIMPIFDIFSIKSIRERRKKRWKKYEPGTKIAMQYTLALVVIGAVGFFIFEYDNTLSGMGNLEKVGQSFFQSVVTRTCGFSSVNMNIIHIPTAILFIALMFIGASSSSTGGGIRTSTFALLYAATSANIKGKKNVELYKRNISKEIIIRAFVIFIFLLIANLISIFLLSITESSYITNTHNGFLNVVFESFSAYSTVGLSMGLTSHLSIYGKYIIMISMFIGRVGLLTIIFLSGRKKISSNYKYPKGNLLVG